MNPSRILAVLPCFLALTACEVAYPPTLRPNNTILVVPSANGAVAIPPTCAEWDKESVNPYDNQPLPQLGCATARNLADMVERPEDLIEGRALAKTRGVTMVGAVRRYDNNQTRGLISPSAEVSQAAATTAPTAASNLTGDVTGGGSSSATAQ